MRRRDLPAAALGGLVMAGCGGTRGAAVGPRGDEFFRGVNFTAEWPYPYLSDGAVERLKRLPRLGVNAVALVPYASQRLGAAAIRFPLRMERDEAIAYAAREARKNGLRVLLKPQVWVRGGYPGDIDPPDSAARATWFTAYRRFVEHYAELAARIDADMFAVGVEFAKLTPYEEEWRELIAVARERYAGPLTYAANFGEEFESLKFWDALDYIGLDNYYPLPANLSTTGIEAKIDAVRLKYDKPVLFTEVGFVPRSDTHERPWEDDPGGEFSLDWQATACEAVLRGFYGKSWLHGMFWWKVGTAGGGPEDDSHRLWGKPAMDVVSRWYRGEGDTG